MIGRIGIRNGNHEIPAVWVCPDGTGPFPVMILCHGTASHKDEVGNLFVQLANRLAEPCVNLNVLTRIGSES